MVQPRNFVLFNQMALSVHELGFHGISSSNLKMGKFGQARIIVYSIHFRLVYNTYFFEVEFTGVTQR